MHYMVILFIVVNMLGCGLTDFLMTEAISKAISCKIPFFGRKVPRPNRIFCYVIGTISNQMVLHKTIVNGTYNSYLIHIWLQTDVGENRSKLLFSANFHFTISRSVRTSKKLYNTMHAHSTATIQGLLYNLKASICDIWAFPNFKNMLCEKKYEYFKKPCVFKTMTL